MKKAVNRFIPRSRKLGSTVVKKLDISSIQEFYIILDNPHKLYIPGDQIKGEIFLTLNKNLLNVSIDLSLTGSIKVKHSLTTSSLRSKKNTLFSHVIRIYPVVDLDPIQNDAYNDDEYNSYNNGLTKGQHIFPFVAQLPKESIFTSISFEKGSIGYKLKAFIGEINSEDESPLFTCEKLLNVIKPINVAKLPTPKIKTLIVKYPTKKLKKTISQTSTTNSSAVSITSQDNGITNNTLPSPDSSLPNKQSISEIDKSKIKLSVELPNLGYLRGELIPVKISLQHIKRVSNLNGIIITLIRICNVDFGPDGPVQSFRKDLSQTIAPLFVDPTTFKALINSSVRIPADVFPTITGNQFITFQYSIEVIVILSNSKGSTRNFQEKVEDDEDLHRIAPKSQTSSLLSKSDSPSDYLMTGVSNLNSNFIFNVDKLKRMKNVLTLNTEVIVGTKRKEQKSGSNRQLRHRSSLVGNTPVSESSSNNQSTPISHYDYSQPPQLQTFRPVVGSSPNDHVSSTNSEQNVDLVTPSPIASDFTQQTVTRLQPPAIPAYENLTEKQILQLQETSLLPSEPVFSRSDAHTTSSISQPHIMELGDEAANRVPRNSSFQSSGELLDYVPEYQEYDKSNSLQEGSPDVHKKDEDDDLYTRSKLASQIEGITVDVTEDEVNSEESNRYR